MIKIQDKKIKKLLQKYKEISLLTKTSALLEWDLNVNLPPKAVNGRAEQSAYITSLIVDKWQDDEFKNLIAVCNENIKNLNDFERAIVRNIEQLAKVYLRVPKGLLVERAKTSSIAFVVWQKAKEQNKFNDFAAHLEKIIKINQLMADHMGYRNNRYDALLDMYEPELTTEECKKIFGYLTREIKILLKKIQKSKNYKEKPNFNDKEFSINDQRQLSLFVLRKMGYDLNAGRMDISSHPFTINLDRFDVRITNRYKVNDFRESIMVAMHEGGHALYEQNINETLDNTPLEGGVSLGIHESQSRFWENQVGRSEEFLQFLAPILQAFYPDQLSQLEYKELVRYFNQVKPSLIRVEADEVTYNLHIAIRFELEEALINNKLKTSELPFAWRLKMKHYLGIEPETDTLGVLQDVHWSYGSFGYFPTYTLGNLYAAQFTKTLEKELNMAELIKKGEFVTLLSWMRSNIHQYGSQYYPKEIVKRVTKESLDPKFFLSYLNQKYATLYK